MSARKAGKRARTIDVVWHSLNSSNRIDTTSELGLSKAIYVVIVLKICVGRDRFGEHFPFVSETFIHDLICSTSQMQMVRPIVWER